MLPPFVKKFDFRGVYDKDIHDHDAYYLGLALTKTIPLKKVLIGWDTRVSSKNLALQFMRALQKNNIEISYLETCPIDYVTAGANAFDFDLSVMFTGSHNPWNWTGLLMHTKRGDSIQGELVEKIISNYYEVQNKEYTINKINLSRFTNFTEEIEKVYAEKLQTLVPLERIKPFKVLVDVGDGSGSRSLSLLEKLLPQVTFSRINDRKLYNADTPHVADPSEIKNMQELMDGIGGFDVGFAFDSDADRVLAVDEKGNYLNGSLLGSAMSEILLELGLPDTRFGYAVDCGPSMYNAIKNNNNGNLLVEAIPVGRSIMRTLLRDDKFDFAVENVGHFYSRDFFMTDSGVFSLAVFLYWMSRNGAPSTLSAKYPDGLRGQAFVPIEKDTENTRQALYDTIQNKDLMKKIEVDGIRYEFFEDEKLTTWYAIRRSGYEPIVKYYLGSLKEEQFKLLKETLT